MRWLVFIWVLGFSGIALAGNLVLYCPSNPGNGVACSNYFWVREGFAPPAGSFLPRTISANFAWNDVIYTAQGSYLGLAGVHACVESSVGVCDNNALYYGVGNVLGGLQVDLIDIGVVAGRGDFSALAVQDVLYAVGIVLCGLVGIGVGVRLL